MSGKVHVLTSEQRPFVNFYAPTFILYELSSPFLNIHWFCDKLNMTGSRLQFINGILLLLTFMSCRLFWGTYQSIRVFSDIWTAYHAGPVVFLDPDTKSFPNATAADAAEPSDLLAFAQGQSVPLWLASTYLASNLILNGLNWFWFTKMIETLRKRFDPPLGTRSAETEKPVHIEIPQGEKVMVEGTHVATPGVEGLEQDGGVRVEKKSGSHLEVEGKEVRARTSTRRRG